jgi:hypothetical protein
MELSGQAVIKATARGIFSPLSLGNIATLKVFSNLTIVGIVSMYMKIKINDKN